MRIPAALFLIVVSVALAGVACRERNAPAAAAREVSPEPAAEAAETVVVRKPVEDFGVRLSLEKVTRDGSDYTFELRLTNTSANVLYVDDPREWDQLRLIEHLPDGGVNESGSSVLIDPGSYSGFIMGPSQTVTLYVVARQDGKGRLVVQGDRHEALEVKNQRPAISVRFLTSVANRSKNESASLSLESGIQELDYPFPLSEGREKEMEELPDTPRSSGGVLPPMPELRH